MTLPLDPSKPADIRLPVNLPSHLRKIHLVGRPGMGRGCNCNSLFERMTLEDLRHGHNVVVLDPRGTFIEEAAPVAACRPRASRGWK